MSCGPGKLEMECCTSNRPTNIISSHSSSFHFILSHHVVVEIEELGRAYIVAHKAASRIPH